MCGCHLPEPSYQTTGIHICYHWRMRYKKMYLVVTAALIITTIIIGDTSVRNLQDVNSMSSVQAYCPGLANGQGTCMAPMAPTIIWYDLVLFILLTSVSFASLLLSLI